MKQIKSAVTTYSHTHTHTSTHPRTAESSVWGQPSPGTYRMAFHFDVVNLCCHKFTTLNHKKNIAYWNFGFGFGSGFPQ